MSPGLELRLAGGPVAPGGVVQGEVVVVGGGTSRSLEVALELWEKTEDHERMASSVAGPPLHDGDLEAGATFAFTLAVPPDAVPSYRSAHGELCWEVHARARRRGIDAHARRPVVVVTLHRGDLR